MGYVIVSDRREPRCGREDCTPFQEPSHWVDVELAPTIVNTIRGYLEHVRAELDNETCDTTTLQAIEKDLMKTLKAVEGKKL